MKVNSILAHYVVLVAWVREVVYLYIVNNAGSYKTEAVLPEYYRVYCSLTNEELSFKVLGLVDQTCLLVSFRIDVRMVHIPLAIHHFIPFPVNHRSSCDCNLEYVRIVGDERYGHESSVAPAMHSDAVLVNIWEFHQHLDALHLVGHLCLSTLSMDGFLKSCTSV